MNRKQRRLREIGVAISRERERQGITQVQLSRMIGYSSHSYLSRIESGQQSPSLDTIFNIADALNVDVRYFFLQI